MAVKCVSCEYCSFSEGNGSPSRWYCGHPKNPSYVQHLSATTIISRGKRHDKNENIPRKKEPRWCPLKGDEE